MENDMFVTYTDGNGTRHNLFSPTADDYPSPFDMVHSFRLNQNIQVTITRDDYGWFHAYFLDNENEPFLVDSAMSEWKGYRDNMPQDFLDLILSTFDTVKVGD
jgi:hypothetical protein